MPVQLFKKYKEKIYTWVVNPSSMEATLLKRNIHCTQAGLSLLAIYLIAIGIVSWGVRSWAFHTALELLPQWVSQLGITEPVYNSSLFSYAIMAFAVFGGITFYWLFQYIPEQYRKLTGIVRYSAPAFAVFALIGMCGASSLLSKCSFGLSFLLLLPSLMAATHASAENAPASKTERILKKYLYVSLLIPILLSLFFAAKAWYPVKLPNDYYELEDAVLLHGSPDHPTNRTEIINCLEEQTRKVDALKFGVTPSSVFARKMPSLMDGFVSEDLSSEQKFNKAIANFSANITSPPPRCTIDISSPELNKTRMPIIDTGHWQSQAGRVLYHHSFVLVPALHFLRYGILSPIPYLYGLGNTLFHALLLDITSPTVTSYFNTYPLAQLTGILLIALAVFYATGSFIAALTGFALILIALFQIRFQYILIPPGFSPLRYAGLSAQIASVFFLFRGASFIRSAAIPFVLAFSYFWNAEFALVGLTGQALAFMCPQLNWGIGKRLSWIAITLMIAALSMITLGFITRGFVQTIVLGFFGISPVLSPLRFIAFCMCFAPAAAFLGYCVTRFEGGERAARVCVLPILSFVMIKFLWYPWYVHLCNCFTLIAPIGLAYMRWAPSITYSTGSKLDGLQRKEILLSVFIVLMCLGSALSYNHDAKSFKRLMVEPFVQQAWPRLGESIPTVTPEAPIAERVEAIRAEVKPEDTVVFLSPFDHLMSIYVNPKHYCGHFELVLNLVTYDLIHSVAECIEHTPDILVVYDDASEAPCPPLWKANYYDMTACGAKNGLKESGKTILKILGPDIVLVKKVGPLSFYRHAGH